MNAHQPGIVNSFRLYRILTGIWVFVVFMVIDFLIYGVIIKDYPYPAGNDLIFKGIWTLVLALTFTAVYNQAATWHPDGQDKPDGPKKKLTKHRIINSILFSLVMGIMFIAIVACSCYLVSIVFIYVLDGFRGIPEDIVDDGVVILQTVAGGLVLEYHGKEETEERRNG